MAFYIDEKNKSFAEMHGVKKPENYKEVSEKEYLKFSEKIEKQRAKSRGLN